MQASDWVIVGRLERSRGRRGEILVRSSWGPEQFLGREFQLLGCPGKDRLHVEQAWTHGDRLILKFAGIDSIGEADTLRRGELAILRADRPALEEEEVYLADLAGCDVVDAGGRMVGVVSGWQQTAGPVLLAVKSAAGDEVLIPFARSIFTKIDILGKRLEVELPEGLLELNRS